LDKFFADIQNAAIDLRRDIRAFGRYLISPEAHVFAFAFAANVLLSFWPFMLVMISFFRNVLHWRAAELAIYIGIQDYFPGTTGNFLAYNMNLLAPGGQKVEILSLFMLLFTANGVFLPLEVALNKAWAVKENRNLLKNQLVSMCLIFGCGGLALLSAALVGGAPILWGELSGQSLAALDSQLTGLNPRALAVPFPLLMVAKIGGAPVTILGLFLVYCFLPNRRLPKMAILPRAIVVGLLLESLKWLNLLIWPWVFHKFDREFGVFKHSVTILTWSFFAGLLLMAGAEWTASRVLPTLPPEPVTGPRRDAPIQDRIGADSV